MMTKNNIPIINHTLAPNVRVFFSQRGIVLDNNPYSSFNVCDYTGDLHSHITECRQQICNNLGIKHDQLIIPRQTHSLNVKIINSLPISTSELQDTDALVTTLRHVAIAINTADCVPIMLADRQQEIIAAIHSGWKGTVGKISAITVEKMISLGSKAENIKAFIGVSICGECFEVGDEVVEQFRNAFPHSPEIIIERQPRRHINLQQACRITLLDCGILPANITLSGICSRCNHNIYFSARHLGINSGRTLTGILQH